MDVEHFPQIERGDVDNMDVFPLHPLKFNMEPENDGLEDHFPF